MSSETEIKHTALRSIFDWKSVFIFPIRNISQEVFINLILLGVLFLILFQWKYLLYHKTEATRHMGILLLTPLGSERRHEQNVIGNKMTRVELSDGNHPDMTHDT